MPQKKIVVESKWKVPILISYAYWDDQVVEDLRGWEGQYRLLLDSGAFTAHTKGKEVDFDEYCAFVKSPPMELEGYFMLDVIGNPEATRRNLDKMLAKGLKPIPIFTRGEDPKWWREYHKVSPLVALGGVATGGADGYVKWFEENVREGLPVHWLGYGKRPMVVHYRPTSFDSTSWVGGCRYGYISLFHLPKEIKVWRPDIIAGRYRKEIEELGFEYLQLRQEENWRRISRESYIGRITTVSWLRWARELEAQEDAATRAYAAGYAGNVGNESVCRVLDPKWKEEKAEPVKAYAASQSWNRSLTMLRGTDSKISKRGLRLSRRCSPI